MSNGTTSEQRAPPESGGNIAAVLPYRYAPRLSDLRMVERRSVLQKLTEATLFKQLSVIRGPAGSGKTTLLAQWQGVCKDMGRPVAWLTVDKADQDLTRFVDGLAAAVEHAGYNDIASGFRDIRSKVLQQSPIQVAQHLAAVCNGAKARFALVLDQYEEMDGDVAGEVLSCFLDHALGVRLLIASRKRFAFSLGRLRTRNQVFEIGPSDLNLTPLETHALFSELPELYARKLYYDTSGEAVALGFARRVIDISAHDLTRAEGWQDQLHEYYRAEVLDMLPQAMREAMSRLVIVERFDLPLASALIGGNATALVERLYYVDGLLLQHRGTQEFYFSEMLRRFLETRLAWLPDDERRALHRRAAAWFADRNRDAEALRHAVEAGDREHALALLDRVGYANLVAQHGVSASHRLLAALGLAPDDSPLGQYLSLAVIHAHEGNIEQAENCLEEVRRTVDEGEDAGSGITDQLALVEAIIASFRDDTLHADTVPALTRCLETGSKCDHEGRALALIFLSWDHFCRGDIAAAEMLANAAAQEYDETEAVFGAVFMHLHRVLYWFWLNKLERALREITLAEQVVRIFFPGDQRLRALIGVLRAGLLFECGRPDPLTDMTELVGIVGALESSPEFQIWSHSQGARAALSQGAGSEARGIIAYGGEVARRLNSPRLEWNLALLSAETSLRLGEIDRAAEEVNVLGIDDAASLSHIPFLTWYERIAGVLLAARIAEAKEDPERAEIMIGMARALTAETTATRMKIELELAEAHLRHSRGDRQAAERHLAVAGALCEGEIPVPLFTNGFDGLHRGQMVLSAAEASRVHGIPTQTAITGREDCLTERERQVMLLLREGHQNKTMAHRLGLSEATVKFHLRNIYRKLNAQNRTQALARYRSPR